MSRMELSIVVATGYLAVYSVCVLIESVAGMYLFLGSPVILLWMVYTIVKDKHEIEKTFDKYF